MAIQVPATSAISADAAAAQFAELPHYLNHHMGSISAMQRMSYSPPPLLPLLQQSIAKDYGCSATRISTDPGWLSRTPVLSVKIASALFIVTVVLMFVQDQSSTGLPWSAGFPPVFPPADGFACS